MIRSLWAETAAPAPDTPSLEDSIRADVAIIGGGYTGLVASLRLAERGTNVVVVEAGDIGAGGSGLNGGQVIPGLKYDPEELVARYGPERGERLVEFAGKTADVVFSLIDEHGIECDAERRGWLQPAHSPKALETIRRRAESWQRRGAPFEVLDRNRTSELLGTDRYFGAGLDRRAGGLHPLSYVRGLARASLGKGARVFSRTRATTLEKRDSAWRVRMSGGASVTAERVLLVTNAYVDGIWPALRETIIAANSLQIATPPLPDEIGRGILPEGQVASDTRRLLRYFRRDRAGRFLMGGRGPFREPRGAEDFVQLKKAAVHLFPSLADVSYEFHWSGRVALTRDHLPHVHEPAPGLTVVLGYNGRGVGLASAVGAALAARVLGGDGSSLPFPVSMIQPIPFHGLKRLYVAAVVSYYRFRDAL